MRISKKRQDLSLSLRRWSHRAIVPKKLKKAIRSWLLFFAKVRENAHNIHAVLKNGWNSCCSGTHKALLQLERRVEDRASEFDVLLAIPATSTVDATNATTSTVYIQQETTINISNGAEKGDGEGVQEGAELLAEPQEGSVSSANLGTSKFEGHSERSHTVVIHDHSDDDNSVFRKREDKLAAIHEWKSRFGQSLKWVPRLYTAIC